MRSFVFGFLCFMLSVLGATPLMAESSSSLQSNLMNPLIGLTGMFLGEAASDEAASDGARYHFGLQAAELTLESTVDSHFKLNANLVFADDEVGAEEVYATTRSLPQVTAKVGKFKASFGKLGALHAHAFPFISQAMAYENTLGAEGFNGGGVEASWMMPLPWFMELTGGVFSAMEQGESPRDWSGARKDDFVYQARARNFFDIAKDATVECGASMLIGHSESGETQRVVGFDLTLKRAPALNRAGHPWNLQAEWLRKDLGVVREQEGWYSHLQYRIARSWWVGGRSERVWRLPEAGWLIGEMDGEGLPLQGSEKRQTIELTWAPSEFTSIRADYSYASIATDAGRCLDRRVLVQFVHTIGTHPAHNY
jgi:hypothetical protein